MAPKDPEKLIRLSKRLAELGLCSRREADAFIEQGLVWVDGERVSTLGFKVHPGQAVSLDPKAKLHQARTVTILLNKPVGYVSGQPEKNYPPAVQLILPANQFLTSAEDPKFQPGHLKGLAPAGRLDIDSQGLMVFTQDGRIARQLIGAETKIEKEYLVRVQGQVTPETLARLRHGLRLDDHALKPAQVRSLNPDQLQFILREGRKRQIRRMCDLVGLKVLGLKRVRIGQVRLGDLPSGQWRYLRPGEEFQA